MWSSCAAPGQASKKRSADENFDDLNVIEQQTELRRAQCKLAREMDSWKMHQEKLDVWEGQAAGAVEQKKQEFLTQQRVALETEADLRFAVQSFQKVSHGITFAGTTRDRFCSSRSLQADTCMHVYYANCPVVGQSALHEVKKLIEGTAPLLHANAERSCLIVIAPNAGAFGNTCNETAIAERVDDILAVLKLSEHKLIVKECIVLYDMKSIPTQSKRHAYHKLWICISNAERDGKLMCKFTFSLLWKRRAVPKQGGMQIAMAGEQQKVDPRVSKDNILKQSQLCRSKQRKQATAGFAFVQAIAECLWDGMDLDSDTPAIWVDLFGYDHSIAEMIMRTDKYPTWPTQCMACLVWASQTSRTSRESKTGPEKKKRRTAKEAAAVCAASNVSVVQWLKKRIETLLQDLVERNILQVKDFQHIPVFGKAESKDSEQGLSIDSLQMIYPTAANTVPLKASALARMRRILKDEELAKSWAESVADHNVKYNPSGNPWDDMPAESNTECTRATPLDVTVMEAKQPGPANPAELEKASGGKTNMQACVRGNLTIYVTAKGGIWAMASEDYLLLPPEFSVRRPLILMLVPGTFMTDTAANVQLKGSSAMRIDFSEDTETAIFRADGSGVESGCHMCVHSWLVELQGKYKVDLHNLQFPPHASVKVEITKDDSGEPSGTEFKMIMRDGEQCIFQPKKPKIKTLEECTWEEIGSIPVLTDSDWDMKTGTHKAGFLKVVPRFHFLDNSRGKTLAPEKPGIAAAKAMQFKKDVLVHLAGPE